MSVSRPTCFSGVQNRGMGSFDWRSPRASAKYCTHRINKERDWMREQQQQNKRWPRAGCAHVLMARCVANINSDRFMTTQTAYKIQKAGYLKKSHWTTFCLHVLGPKRTERERTKVKDNRCSSLCTIPLFFTFTPLVESECIGVWILWRKTGVLLTCSTVGF